MKGREEKEIIEGMRQGKDGGKSVFVDYELYAEYLEDSNLTEEQKYEFLQALWGIICAFVDLGFGVHPVQQAGISCGKTGNFPPDSGAASPDQLNCADSRLIAEFVDVAAQENGSVERESGNE